MVIFHSYVSLPEGNFEVQNPDFLWIVGAFLKSLEAQAAAEKATAQAASVTEVRGSLADVGKDVAKPILCIYILYVL
jgi:hypothetical protein